MLGWIIKLPLLLLLLAKDNTMDYTSWIIKRVAGYSKGTQPEMIIVFSGF